MARGLDHIVHVVRDLDAAGEFYALAGFMVGARNRHPWGTHNRIVQFPGVFIELLTVAEPDRLADEGIGRFFGGYARDVLAGGAEGLAMLVLESRDAKEDARRYAASGIGLSDALRFEREGRTADGAPVQVAFSVAFVEDARSPARYFVCEQHYPQNFWNAALQRHANSVDTVAGVALIAERPGDHAAFLAAFTGVDPDAGSNPPRFRTPRGDVEVFGREAFRRAYGVAPPDASRGARLAALRFTFRDRGALLERLARAGVPEMSLGQRIVVPPTAAFGATLVFDPTGGDGS